MQCEKCESTLTKTDWRPPVGIDPQLRQFKCGTCGEVFYSRSENYIRTIMEAANYPGGKP